MTIVSGSLLGQGLVIVAYPVLTRLYDPGEFGMLAVFAAIVGPLSVAATGSFQAAIPIPVDDDAAAAVAWTGLIWASGTAVVATALSWVATPLADDAGVPRLADHWWLVGPTVLAIGTYTVLSQWMVRTESYGALGRRNVLQGVGQVGTQVGLGALGVRPLGLLAGLGVGRLVALGGLLSRRGLLGRARPTRAALRAVLARFRRFPLLSMPSRVLNNAGLEVPLLAVSALYGDARAGMLALSMRVIGAPSTVIGDAVLQVFVGRSSASLREGRGTMGRQVRGSVGRLLLVGSVPALVLLGLGPGLFAVVFGSEWTEAGVFARYLALSYLLQFAVAPISGTLHLLERQALGLAWAASRLVLTVGGPVLCALLGAPIGAAIVALGLAHIVGYAGLYVLSVRAADLSDAEVVAARDRVED